MNRNQHKKISFKDWFAYHYYPEHAKRSITKQEKKKNHRAMREFSKKTVQEEWENYERELEIDKSYCNYDCPNCTFNDDCNDYSGYEYFYNEWLEGKYD